VAPRARAERSDRRLHGRRAVLRAEMGSSLNWEIGKLGNWGTKLAGSIL